MLNPIESVTEWCEGVGHGKEQRDLYIALVLEECAELLSGLEVESRLTSADLRTAERSLMLASRNLRSGAEKIVWIDRASTLDAALDVAWVSLCLAKTLTGNRLPEAWAELHRSNVSDKQVTDYDGNRVFVKDESGKVRKPADWKEPDFAQFLEGCKCC